MLFRTALASYRLHNIFLFYKAIHDGNLAQRANASFVDSLQMRLLVHIFAKENSFGKAKSNRFTATLDTQMVWRHIFLIPFKLKAPLVPNDYNQWV